MIISDENAIIAADKFINYFILDNFYFKFFIPIYVILLEYFLDKLKKNWIVF